MSETQKGSLPKTMLILKSHTNALVVVETFLRNRGWILYSTANLKEALVQMMSLKPSYVLITVDHSNKKVAALPKLLASAFPVATFVFAETPTSTSFKNLNDAPTDYRIYHPVTGPAIERCVNKYLKDQQTKISVAAKESLRSDKNTEDKISDTVSVKGGVTNNISIKGDGAEFGTDNVSRMLSQFLGEDSGNSTSSSTTAKADDNVVFAQALEESDKVPSGQATPSQKITNGNQNQPSNLESTGDDTKQQSEPRGFGHTYVQKGSAGNIGTYVPPTDDNNDSNHFQKNNPDGHPNSSGTQEGPGGESEWGRQGAAPETEGSAPQTANTGNPPNEGLGSREYRRNQAAGNWAPMENKARLEPIGNPRALSDASENLIARGTQKSLEESVEVGDGMIKDKLEETTSAACIVIESEKFSGYLVAVMGKNRKIDQAFVESIKAKLFKFLKENGEEISDKGAMDVKIKQVDFEPWALDYADFLRKSVHQGNEVAMAFFPRRQIKTILEDSENVDMAKIHLKELQGDCQVEFDIYVYLPNNNKYVLYTPKGGVFYNKQMDRLKKQGVTHMHVQRDAIAAIAKYQAQNYLNDLIDDHDQKQEVITKVKKAS